MWWVEMDSKKISCQVFVFIFLILFSKMQVTAQSPTTLLTNPIYVQSTGLPGGPTDKVNLVSDAGYQGLMWENQSSDFPELLSALKSKKSGLIGIWRNAGENLSDDFMKLDTIGRFIFLYFPGNGYSNDSEAIASVIKVADLASLSGRKVAIYTHAPDYISNSVDAVKIAKLANRPNVGISFNLCHELMYCNNNHKNFSERFDSLTRYSMPYIFTVSISGADSVGNSWDVLIRPLGEGNFNTFPIVKTLIDKNFKGPFLLQAFGLKQDPKTHLDKSMSVWKSYQNKLNATTITKNMDYSEFESKDQSKDQSKGRIKSRAKNSRSGIAKFPSTNIWFAVPSGLNDIIGRSF